MTNGLRGTAELLFVEAGERGFEVDCIVVEDDDSGPHGEPHAIPLTLYLSEPQSAVLRWTVERRLAAWASDGEIVRLQLDRRRGRPRARLESETTRLNLELAGAAGV